MAGWRARSARWSGGWSRSGRQPRVRWRMMGTRCLLGHRGPGERSYANRDCLNQLLLILIQADNSPDNLGHIASSEDAQTPLLHSVYGSVSRRCRVSHLEFSQSRMTNGTRERGPCLTVRRTRAAIGAWSSTAAILSRRRPRQASYWRLAVTHVGAVPVPAGLPHHVYGTESGTSSDSRQH
jgi:hypothetical protein